ncbi:hypothetical protein [Nocardioides insulae]|uniref:hypothetical protein n=1 Tax=Nocardioides insulae TaxID=394734 RepID=UPI000400BAE0|nr:hypothetical protein [Nocardioides insulae]
MTTIDLGSPTPPAPTPPAPLDAVPRRAALTLPELRLAAEHASGAPLPFDLAAPRGGSALDARLGVSPGTVEEQVYTEALAALHDAEESLARRGLLSAEGRLERGLAGAMGLLATPVLALDLDVAVEESQLHAWHRQAGEAVATLATVDGLVFELSWFATSAWPGELARVAVLPEETALGASALEPDSLLVPFELVSATTEAHRSGRTDLVPVLAAHHQITDPDGRPLPTGEVATLLGALAGEARGRLRALAADVSAEATTMAGVLSWTLLTDGWRALRPVHRDGELWVDVRRIEPGDLAQELAPVLSELSAGASA